MIGKTIKRYFITGLVVLIPIGITALVVGWLFGVLDGWATPLSAHLFGHYIPGIGIIITCLAIFLTGLLSSNIVGRWLLGGVERLLMDLPVFKSVYTVSKQVMQVFSPREGSQSSFQRVVLVEHPHTGALSLGFVTHELNDPSQGHPRQLVAVYVPTNHLYLGDTFLLEPEKVHATRLTVQEGIQGVISAGATLPDNLLLGQRK